MQTEITKTDKGFQAKLISSKGIVVVSPLFKKEKELEEWKEKHNLKDEVRK